MGGLRQYVHQHPWPGIAFDTRSTPMTNRTQPYIHLFHTLQACPAVYPTLARNEKAKVAGADGFFNQGYLTKMQEDRRRFFGDSRYLCARVSRVGHKFVTK